MLISFTLVKMRNNSTKFTAGSMEDWNLGWLLFMRIDWVSRSLSFTSRFLRAIK